MKKLIEIGKFFVSSAITDKNGLYKLEKVLPGKYSLVLPINLPKEYSLYKETKIPKMPIELSEGKNLTDVNFEISHSYGTISGKVFMSDGVTPYKVGIAILKEDNEILSRGSDNNGVFKFDKYKPSSGESKIMLCYEEGSYSYNYVSDIILDLSLPRNITGLNIVAGEMPLTGFFGVVKNMDNTIFSEGYVRIKSTKWKLLDITGFINEQGHYEVKGFIPGEYTITIHPISLESDIIRSMTIDSNFSINSVGEQKEVNLIYDSSKSKIKKVQPRIQKY
jgi:hypothetical protein